MKTLLILNDPPYGTERSFNGLRLAKALAGKGAQVTIFLMADAVACAKAGQKVPQGFYNLELMVNAIRRKGEVLLCGTCMDARGIGDAELAPDHPAIPAGRLPRRLAEPAELGAADLTPIVHPHEHTRHHPRPRPTQLR
jgi:uncharacterized protein involved in oxidation of intracellular sulfur